MTAEQAGIRKFDSGLWFTMLGPPVVWLVYLQTIYLVALRACSKGQLFAMHVTAGFFLTLAVIAGALAFRQWKTAGSKWPSEEGAEGGRRRAMAMIGLLQSALFSMIIITTWAAICILDPCQNVHWP